MAGAEASYWIKYRHKYVVPLKPFLLNATCLAVKQEIPILYTSKSLFDPPGAQTHELLRSRRAR